MDRNRGCDDGSHLSGIEVGQLQPETRDGELDVGPSLLHARRFAQHPRHLLIRPPLLVHRFEAGGFTDSMNAFSGTNEAVFWGHHSGTDSGNCTGAVFKIAKWGFAPQYHDQLENPIWIGRTWITCKDDCMYSRTSFIFKYKTSLNDAWFHKGGKGVGVSYL